MRIGFEVRILFTLNCKSCTIQNSFFCNVKIVFSQHKLPSIGHRELVIVPGPENGVAVGQVKDNDFELTDFRTLAFEGGSSATDLNFQFYIYPEKKMK
jgi:hypothetical protein